MSLFQFQRWETGAQVTGWVGVKMGLEPDLLPRQGFPTGLRSQVRMYDPSTYPPATPRKPRAALCVAFPGQERCSRGFSVEEGAAEASPWWLHLLVQPHGTVGTPGFRASPRHPMPSSLDRAFPRLCHGCTLAPL